MTKIYPILSADGSGFSSAKPVFTYSDLIIAYLCQIEVEYIFGIPGGAIEGLFDALARCERGQLPDAVQSTQRALERKSRRLDKMPQLVVCRNEAGAAFMADGYSRETGKLGVCCSTTGPGATNLLTGVSNAYVDKVPMLVITPQTALPSFGQRGFQESSSDLVDVVSMFEQCTRYSTLISHADQLEGKLCTALSTAFRHPRGPVHLSIPADILCLPVRNATPQFNVATLLREPSAVDVSSYKALVVGIGNSLAKGKSITLFLGEDCGDASREIIQFAEMIGAKIVSSPTGKRWVSAYHPQYFGVFGFAGHQSARAVLTDNEVDLVLAVGTSLGELDTAGWDTQALLNDRLIHIASSMSNFDRSPMAYLHVYGNLRTLFSRLIEDFGSEYCHLPVADVPAAKENFAHELHRQLLPSNIVLSEPEKCFSESSPLKPQRLMCELLAKFPKEATYVVETGNAWSWATHYLQLDRSHRYHVAMGFGSMGWAISACIGASLADRKKPVVCIAGDGAYLMSAQEITVAVEHKLPVIYVILNDSALGMVKHGQALNQAEQIGVNLPAVDYAALARAAGAKGIRIENWCDWQDIDSALFQVPDGPVLLDVLIDGEEIPPMKSRLNVLQEARCSVDIEQLDVPIV